MVPRFAGRAKEGIEHVVDISVVIPTYNRAATLHRCLTALQAQTLDPERYEILVVDDASPDETPATLRQFDRIRAFRQSRNAGPAAARNVAIRSAVGTDLLFLDDDVVVPPTLLAQHVAAHADLPGDHIAILGNTKRPAGQSMSPLERHLANHPTTGGALDERIADPDNVSFGLFITCHVSVGRSFLLRHGLFDEEFPYAWGEDTELGYRLQQHGLRIVFRPEIVVRHFHSTSYVQARRKRWVAGEVAFLMARKHPELTDLSFLNRAGRSRLSNWVKRRATEGVLDPVLEWADRRRFDYAWLARTYEWSLRHHQDWRLEDVVHSRRGRTPTDQRRR